MNAAVAAVRTAKAALVMQTVRSGVCVLQCAVVCMWEVRECAAVCIREVRKCVFACCSVHVGDEGVCGVQMQCACGR